MLARLAMLSLSAGAATSRPLLSFWRAAGRSSLCQADQSSAALVQHTPVVVLRAGRGRLVGGAGFELLLRRCRLLLLQRGNAHRCQVDFAALQLGQTGGRRPSLVAKIAHAPPAVQISLQHLRLLGIRHPAASNVPGPARPSRR